MQTYTRYKLSGSTDGLNIAVTASSVTVSTTVHTALSGTAGFDEVYLWASNVSSQAAPLNITWGGSSAANHICSSVSIPPNSGPIPILTGQNLQNSQIVGVYSATTSAINVNGFINRIS